MFVEHFPSQVLEGQQSKILKTYRSEGQCPLVRPLSPLVLVNLVLNSTFMFILGFYLNSKTIEDRV